MLGPHITSRRHTDVAAASSTSIVIPAFNEGVITGDVVSQLKALASWHEIIVIDDGSSDDTGAQARQAGATVITHPYTKGNGAAVKTGIRYATGEFILIVDGDGQHRTEDALHIVEQLGEYDLVVGARSSVSQATPARRAGNFVLSCLASYLAEHPIPDLTSGFRAMRHSYVKDFIHLLPNGFSTPTTTTLAFIKAGYNVTFVPSEAHVRAGHSKIRFVRDGVKFFLILLRVITIYSPLRIFVPAALTSFTVGSGYMLWTILFHSRVTNSSVLLIVLGVVVFLMGLVCEQISAIRFDRRK